VTNQFSGSLLGRDTVWILYCGESHTTKDYPHFVGELSLAHLALKQGAVDPGNIHCFVDLVEGPTAESLSNFRSHLHDPRTFVKTLATLEAQNIVFAATGHGSQNGLEGVIQLSPNTVISALRGVAKAQRVLVMLAQCFAGIFDFMDIHGHPQSVIIGATKLNSSIRVSNIESINLFINVFWYYFFLWIAYPNDVDGDGVFSASDLYKDVACKTNLHLTLFKAGQTKNLETWCHEKQRLANITKDPLVKMDIIAALDIQAQIYHTHQEPWILNANASRNIIF
jgi:hypothetical protein